MVSGYSNLRHTHNLYKEVTHSYAKSFPITTFTKVSGTEQNSKVYASEKWGEKLVL